MELLKELKIAKANYDHLKNTESSQVLYYNREIQEARNYYEQIHQSFFMELESAFPAICYLLRVAYPEKNFILDGVSGEFFDGERKILYLCPLEMQGLIIQQIQEVATLSRQEKKPFTGVLNRFSSFPLDFVLLTIYQTERPKYIGMKEWVDYFLREGEDFAELCEISMASPYFPVVKLALYKLVESGILHAKNGILNHQSHSFPLENVDCKHLIRVPDKL